MSAEGIFANLVVCIPLGLFMLLLFVYFRSRLPLFYHRNILCHGRPVLGMSLEGGFGGWVGSILRLQDGELMKLGGLDTVVTSNAARSLVILACVMAIPCLLIVTPFYYFNSDTTGSPVTFDTFTIADLYTGSMFWPPLLVLAFLTVVTLYGVYTFYTNFVGLRQAYLLRPSSLESVGAFLSRAEDLGSIKAAHRRVDLSTVTVLLHPIPADLLDSDRLKETLEHSGIHGIETVQFVGNYGKVAGLMGKRNASLNKLEGALKTVSDGLRSQTKSAAAAGETEEELTVKAKSDLLNRLINDVNFCASVRPRHKTGRPAGKKPEPSDAKGTVDSLRHHYAKLVERDEELQEALEEFNSQPKLERKSAETEADSPASPSEDFEKRYIDETTFISWSKIKNFSANLAQVASLESDQCALIHFSDYREAARAQQLMISSRPNSMETATAPGPDQLNWTFMKWSHRQRWHGALSSNVRYWLFVLAFAPVLATVAAFIDMRSLAKWSPAIESFRTAHPNFQTFMEGVLAPFCTTLIMKRAGMWIAGIISLRGPMSRPELALKVQSAHLFFLFFQVIIIGAIFSNLYELSATAVASNYKLGGFLVVLRDNIPKKSHFFFNFVLQDVFSELMLELLNPKSLFLDRSFLNEKWRTGKTARSLLLHDTNPPELELALIWSRFIMFPLLIFMTYAIISPLIVVPTLIYFSYAYFVYRFRFAQFGRRAVETGGQFWKQCSRQVIYALILGQLSVFLQYTQFRRGILPSCLIALLLALTAAFVPFLSRHFGRICDNLSVLEEEVEGTKRLAVDLLKDRNDLVSGAVEYLEDSAIVKSKLENEAIDHLNFTDIDPLAGGLKADFNPPESQPNLPPPLFDPYWSIFPLNCSSSEETASGTFDPFQVDRLLDPQYINKQYSHPLLMKHTQVLIAAKDLPALLLRESNTKTD